MLDARHYEAREILRNGLEVTIRALHPDDGERIAEAFSKLEADSIYTRFFGPKTGLTEKDYATIRDMDFDTRVALLATRVEDGREIVIGSCSYGRFAPDAAEVAFLVEEDYHGLGLARRLLQHLGRIAVARGLTRFEAEVLPFNKAMLKVFAASGWPVTTRNEDGTVHVVLELGAAAAAG
ncbi:MAG: GNAT family N-acetyltransferase [Betaproteobacteria bacterium]|nr:GNAT family N-acetyltransferase [Betaproteobacteria bacterium]